MNGLLGRFFARKGEAGRPMDYGRARALARHPDAAVRRDLAARTDVQPEILYYLVEDDAPDVRRAIAANEATPAHAYAILARDRDDDVRCDLAARIARLTPGLSTDARDRIRELTEEAFEILARDQIVQVRKVLAEALKDIVEVPGAVIGRLARDTELAVAAPVLEFSPLLTEDDLLDIIASPQVAGAVTCISRRAGLSERISDAVVDSRDWDAVAALLGNTSAQIREETLDRIVETSRDVPKLQMPVANRPGLPAGAVRKLAGFVTDAVLASLMRRSDLDPETAALVGEKVRARMRDAVEQQDGAASPDDQEGLSVSDEVQALFDGGQLDKARIESELGSGNRAFVIHALAVRARLPVAAIERIIAARSAKPMTALAWKAGLPMVLAVKLQRRLAGLSTKEVLQPRNLTEYPLSEDDMAWQLDLYGG